MLISLGIIEIGCRRFRIVFKLQIFPGVSPKNIHVTETESMERCYLMLVTLIDRALPNPVRTTCVQFYVITCASIGVPLERPRFFQFLKLYKYLTCNRNYNTAIEDISVIRDCVCH